MACHSVAPYESCIACLRGDTTTIVSVQGEAEFVIAVMHHLAGLSLEDAQRTFLVIAAREYGCDPGSVPGGRITTGFRLCRDCAAKTGAHVVEVRDATSATGAPGSVQPGSDA